MILGLLVLAVAAAPLVAHHDPHAVDVTRRLQAPSRQFWMGTDHLGRDVWARLVFGGRISIGATALAALGSSLIGIVLGVLAGFSGRVVDTAVSRLIDLVLAFPGFLLALALVGILGPSLRSILIALVVVSWAGYARIVRGTIIAERNKAYVDAATALGASRVRVAARHMLPNVVAPVIVLTTLDMGGMLLGISGLSFLGLGLQPPAAEWGTMLAEARNYLGEGWHLTVFPGLAILFAVLAFNLVGDGLRDALDPRTRQVVTGLRHAGPSEGSAGTR